MRWFSLIFFVVVPTGTAAFVSPRQTSTRVPIRLYAHGTLDDVEILPAKRPLHSFFVGNASSVASQEFSILCWNTLLPNSQDNWWNHKMYASWVPMEKREWSHRLALIRERLLLSGADVICIQEADGDTFEQDFAFLKEAGYNNILHKKFRFRCATFFKENKFVLDQSAHKDRTLVISLRSVEGNHILNVVNCHLSGGAAPERRLRQVYEALEQIRKWKAKVALTLEKQRKANRPSPRNILKAEESLELHENAGIIVCGDFNSDGNTGVRRFLVEGSIDPEWREPQYLDVPLTLKRKGHSYSFVDAAELAYASNVCDGDYGENPEVGCRPATYVVPNLVPLLLLPIQGETIPRTQFGQQIARGLADTLGLADFCENEMVRAFESIDLDGNNLIDEDEVQKLLESAYVSANRREIEEERRKFFSGFRDSSSTDQIGLSREQISEKLIGLQQELEGPTKQAEFSKKMARGLADTLGLADFCENEIDRAFDSIDLDGNNLVDEDEIQKLLESVYLSAYGQQIEEERRKFFSGFKGSTIGQTGLSREQLTEKLIALQQELEGGREGSEIVEVRTEADAQRMIGRFSPLLRDALDQVFDDFSGDDGEALTEDEVAKFLVKTNGQLGRGGTSQHTTALFKRKAEASQPTILTRQDWYGVFARELGEGMWWQVVYDLEVCGANLRSRSENESQHYQGWLDYMYFGSQQLTCTGVQEALSASEVSRIYDDGDALPNEWHPSDHLPVAALFSWQASR